MSLCTALLLLQNFKDGSGSSKYASFKEVKNTRCFFSFFLNIFNRLKTCFVLDSHGWKTTCFSIIPSSFVLYYFLYLDVPCFCTRFPLRESIWCLNLYIYWTKHLAHLTLVSWVTYYLYILFIISNSYMHDKTFNLRDPVKRPSYRR